jgi:hypothetical protein
MTKVRSAISYASLALLSAGASFYCFVNNWRVASEKMDRTLTCSHFRQFEDIVLGRFRFCEKT